MLFTENPLPFGQPRKISLLRVSFKPRKAAADERMSRVFVLRKNNKKTSSRILPRQNKAPGGFRFRGLH